MFQIESQAISFRRSIDSVPKLIVFIQMVQSRILSYLHPHHRVTITPSTSSCSQFFNEEASLMMARAPYGPGFGEVIDCDVLHVKPFLLKNLFSPLESFGVEDVPGTSAEVRDDPKDRLFHTNDTQTPHFVSRKIRAPRVNRRRLFDLSSPARPVILFGGESVPPNPRNLRTPPGVQQSRRRRGFALVKPTASEVQETWRVSWGLYNTSTMDKNYVVDMSERVWRCIPSFFCGTPYSLQCWVYMNGHRRFKKKISVFET